MRAGFLTSSVQGLDSTNVFAGSHSGSSGTLISISSISKAASGSLAAIGGEGAIYGAGGRGGIRRSSSQFENPSDQESSEAFAEGVELKLSLPGIGAYLKVRPLFVLSIPDLKSLLNRTNCSESGDFISPLIGLQRPASLCIWRKMLTQIWG